MSSRKPTDQCWVFSREYGHHALQISLAFYMNEPIWRHKALSMKLLPFPQSFFSQYIYRERDWLQSSSSSEGKSKLCLLSSLLLYLLSLSLSQSCTSTSTIIIITIQVPNSNFPTHQTLQTDPIIIIINNIDDHLSTLPTTTPKPDKKKNISPTTSQSK